MSSKVMTTDVTRLKTQVESLFVTSIVHPSSFITSKTFKNICNKSIQMKTSVYLLFKKAALFAIR
jgi:hypothetical protein